MSATDVQTPDVKGQAPDVLSTRALVKRFGGITALKGVDFSLRKGEIHSLCGENGAGKSTLIKTLSGTYGYGTYEGQILVDGVEQKFTSIRDAEAVGLGVIHQELALVPEMTVAENIFLGHEPTRFGLVDHDRMYTDSTRLLEQFGIVLPANARIQDLGVGQKQLVEIAKALHRRSRILILDEPTAALTEQEVAVLLAIILDLAKRGVACVYISHKLDEVFAISDRITVIRDGESIATVDVPNTDRNAIVAHMVGRPIDNLFPRRRSTPGEVALSVQGLTASEVRGGPERLRDVSFTLRCGEVLGIGGLMGAGRSEVLMHLFGMWGYRIRGTATMFGAALSESPQACIEQGLALVTEDRKRYGLVLEQEVGFNLSLSALGTFCTLGLVDQGSEVRANQSYVKTLRIKVASLEVAVNTLSGGNQQKVVIGKALMTKPKIVLLDEPTRGIDVGAKLEIYELINELTAQGVAVILVSSELPELIGMSDRIVMLAEGCVGGVFDELPFEQRALMHAAMRTTAQTAARNATTERAPDQLVGGCMKTEAKVGMRDFSMLIALVLILAYFGAVDPTFLSARNLSQLAIELSATAVLSLGMLLIILPGHIDLSAGSGVGLAGGLAAVFITKQGWGAPEALLVTMFLSMAIYAAMGAIVVFERMPAFIITLGGLLVFKGVHWLVIDNGTVPVVPGGEENIYSVLTTYYVPPMASLVLGFAVAVTLGAVVLRDYRQRKTRGFEVDSELSFLNWLVSAQLILLFVLMMNQYRGLPLSILILGVTAVVIHVACQHLKFGRYLYAIGGNEEAAVVSGVPANWVVVSAFGAMGLVVAIAGYLQTAFAGASTTTTGQLMELDAIAACVIGGTSLKGGRGSVVGVLFGALIMAALLNGMTLLAFSPETKFIARGVVLALAVWMDIRLSRGSARR